MNDPLGGLAAMGLAILAFGAVLGFYADHQRQKYEALAEAQREAGA